MWGRLRQIDNDIIAAVNGLTEQVNAHAEALEAITEPDECGNSGHAYEAAEGIIFCTQCGDMRTIERTPMGLKAK